MKDGYCMGGSLVLSKMVQERKGYVGKIRKTLKGKNKFLQQVEQLYADVQLAPGLLGVQCLEILAKHSLFIGMEISAFDHDGWRFFCRKGAGLKLDIFLLDNHYYTLTSVCALLGKKNFCRLCGVGYQKRSVSPS